jgi:Tol biopolymer transport system component
MSGLDFSPDGRRISFVEGQQLRTGTIDLKGRVTVATEQPGMNYGRLVSQDVSYPAVTKWSADGAHLAVNVYKPFVTGDPKSTDEGPFLGMYTARGSDFTLPSEYVGDFDW